MVQFYIGGNMIQIWEESRKLRTTFPDGSFLDACPEDTEEYRKTAKELGYDCTKEMCFSHEILHTALAIAEGKPYSRGLWRAAHGIGADVKDFEEEDRVMKLQKKKI